MSTFKIYLNVQPVAVEIDDGGEIVNEHALPPERVYYPWARGIGELVKKRLAELQPKEEEKNDD